MLHAWSKDSMPSKRVRSPRNSASSSRSTAAGEEHSMDMAMAAAFTRSFQVTRIDSGLDDLKADINRIYSTVSKLDEKLDRIENKFDILLEKYESLIPKYATQPENTEVIPKESLYNEISGWIRSAIYNLKIENIEWDFHAPLGNPNNINATNKILESVGSQISSITEAPWIQSISHQELKLKIILVFRRNKSKFNMTSDKKAFLKKMNVRKTRRVIKTKRRKQILEHELFGPAMRGIFGDDVDELIKEQLQSDEESTDSEMGETEKTGKLRVIHPSWRSKKAVEAFRKFDEYDTDLRKNATKEREPRIPGRTKVVNIKRKYLDSAPAWAKA
ncbi:hypothetical protein BDF21DRAFT_450198 [Thamnidium elegans]|nr:hypothetical protein BDF21DRAFT_450198 [Thamnidium elegans]